MVLKFILKSQKNNIEMTGSLEDGSVPCFLSLSI